MARTPALRGDGPPALCRGVHWRVPHTVVRTGRAVQCLPLARGDAERVRSAISTSCTWWCRQGAQCNTYLWHVGAQQCWVSPSLVDPVSCSSGSKTAWRGETRSRPKVHVELYSLGCCLRQVCGGGQRLMRGLLLVHGLPGKLTDGQAAAFHGIEAPSRRVARLCTVRTRALS